VAPPVGGATLASTDPSSNNIRDRQVDARLDALEKGLTKDVVKEALKEWLDEKFALVGKWTVQGILAAALAALVYFILAWNGWKQP
jgi:hypothetical protein